MGHGSFGQGRLWVFEAAKSEEEFSIRRSTEERGGWGVREVDSLIRAPYT